MNVNTAMDLLGLRLEDEDKTRFPVSARLKALNNAQYTLAMLLDDRYLLTDLGTIEENISAPSGVLTLTSLSQQPLRGVQGIIKVKPYGGSYWSSEEEFERAKKMENGIVGGSVTNPRHYVFGNKLYLFPTTITALDVYFIRKPLDLYFDFTSNAADAGASATAFDGAASEGLSAVDDYYNGAVVYNVEKGTYHVVTDYVGADLAFTVSPAATTDGDDGVANFTEGQTFRFLTHSFDEQNLSNVNFDLDEAFHPLILDLAVGELWQMQGSTKHGGVPGSDRASAVLKVAYMEIETMNAKYKDADGVGSRG